MPTDLTVVDAETGEIVQTPSRSMPLARPASFTESLIQVALEKGLNPVELYGILRDERAMNAKAAFSAAKAKFQADCPPICKTATSQFTRVTGKGTEVQTRFASLEVMQTIADPHLHANGFSYDWKDASDAVPAGKIKLLFILQHVGGHFEECPCTITAPQKAGCSEPQKDGIAYEYARRQSFRNGTGIRVVGEDLDGDTSDGATIASKADIDEIVRLIDETQSSTPDFLKWAKCGTIAEFPADKVVEAKRLLRQKQTNAAAAK